MKSHTKTKKRAGRTMDQKRDRAGLGYRRSLPRLCCFDVAQQSNLFFFPTLPCVDSVPALQHSEEIEQVADRVWILLLFAMVTTKAMFGCDDSVGHRYMLVQRRIHGVRLYVMRATRL